MSVVLFICTANRFRSPIAEACFRQELVTRQLDAGCQVSSAGTWTTDGMPATQSAISGARYLGLDITSHRSRIVNAELMGDADLIIVMEQGQKEALQAEFPRNAPKVHLLSEVATGLSYDIPDPGSLPLAGDVHAEIHELIHAGFDRIYAMVAQP